MLKYLSPFDWAVHRFSEELALWEAESRKVTQPRSDDWNTETWLLGPGVTFL